MLVDTCVWIDHLRAHDPRLATLLERGEAVCHPFVIGELACGDLRPRKEILGLLADLPTAAVALHEEVLEFVESQRLMGSGIGWVDVHLLVSARLYGTPIWTHDRRLESVARRLGIANRP